MRSFLLAACVALSVQASPDGDLITNLPGLSKSSNLTMYSGFVPVKQGEIFYWLVKNKDPNAPLVLWTNGGPGCSGVSGLLTEQGPFSPDKNGNLIDNPTGWHTAANMIFVEQPIGVGFSTAESGVDYGDAEAASNNYLFLSNFLKKFPEFKDNDMFITSESYGGHYMPTLAAEIVARGGLPTFKGFMVGNPLTWMPYRNWGQFGTWANHELIPKPMLDSYLKAGCKADDSSDACQNIENEMAGLTQNMNPYALDFPVCVSGGDHTRYTMAKTIERASGKKVGGYFPESYQPCVDNYANTWLNRDDVQKALHAQASGKKVSWSECSMAINQGFNQTDVNAPMMPIYKSLMTQKKQKLNMMIYSGDDDSVCATLGSQQFIWDLGFNVSSAWAPWSTAGQTSGFHVEFEATNNLAFTTVHGAGHMVPQTRPVQALQLFKTFLSGKW